MPPASKKAVGISINLQIEKWIYRFMSWWPTGTDTKREKHQLLRKEILAFLLHVYLARTTNCPYKNTIMRAHSFALEVCDCSWHLINGIFD